MALTKAQKEEIARVARKNAAKRAELLAKKITDMEARTVSSSMNKRPGSAPGFISKQTAVLSKSERNELGRTMKANAESEKKRQKQRSFAKGEGKLPLKERVGTKAEYKKLGEDIKTRKQLIAYAKQAKINQAERAKNPKPAKAAATPAKEAKPVAEKKTTPAKTTAKKAAVAPKVKKSTPAKKTAAAPKAPKASTAAIKERTTPKTKAKTIKPKATKTPQLQTLKEAEAKAPKPKSAEPKKLQTLEEAKAKAPKPTGKANPMSAAEFDKTMSKAPSNAPLKPKGKVASSKAGKTASKVAKTTLGQQAIGVGKKVAKNKFVRVGGKLVKIGAAIGVGREVAQVVSGQAEKDFRRIQALENRIAAAKGQKPKYTKVGSNRNLDESLKTGFSNIANVVSGGVIGQGRKGRIQELKTMLKKVEGKKPAANKPSAKPNAKPAVTTTTGGQKAGATPKAITGNKYRVTSGDTLSGIASRAGVSLSELRKANPQITDPRKIYRNTGVVIPKGGKVPTGGYAKKAK